MLIRTTWECEPCWCFKVWMSQEETSHIILISVQPPTHHVAQHHLLGPNKTEPMLFLIFNKNTTFASLPSFKREGGGVTRLQCVSSPPDKKKTCLLSRKTIDLLVSFAITVVWLKRQESRSSTRVKEAVTCVLHWENTQPCKERHEERETPAAHWFHARTDGPAVCPLCYCSDLKNYSTAVPFSTAIKTTCADLKKPRSYLSFKKNSNLNKTM